MFHAVICLCYIGHVVLTRSQRTQNGQRGVLDLMPIACLGSRFKNYKYKIYFSAFCTEKYISKIRFRSTIK